MKFVMKHMRAFIVGAVVLGLLVAGGVWFMYNLPMSIVGSLIQSFVTTDQSKRASRFEKDALYVITTGTGAPLPDLNRASSQTVVIAGYQLLVFDTGPGSTLRLELLLPDISAIDALFLTHYHSDHIGDMGELMLKRWATRGPSEPLPIYGPPGIEKVVTGFEAAYQLDRGYRITHHGEETVPPSGFGGDVHMFDLGSDLTSSEVVYAQGDVEVIAFNVDHAPVFPAVGYRVNYKDRSVVISGDTIFTESLINHTMGADLFISEAINHEMTEMLADAGRDSETNLTVVAEDIQDYHITLEQAGIVVRDAGVSLLLITHALPPIRNDLLVNPFLRDARAVFSGDVRMANDGTMVAMPVNSDEVRVTELLK